MAYKFNGSNQWLSVDSAPASAYPFTMSCWFNSEDTTINQQLMALWANDGSRFYYGLFADGTQTNDPVVLFTFKGSFQGAVTTTGYTANKWHHACGVFSSATSRTVYIDGGSSATSTANLSLTPNALRLGRFVDGSGNPSLYLKGQLADAGVWSAALTAAEVQSLARGVSCQHVRPQSLAFYAPMMRDLIDIRAGAAITNNNTATVEVHPRIYA